MGRGKFESRVQEELEKRATWAGRVVPFFRKEFDVDVMGEYGRLKDVGMVPLDKLRDREVLMRELNEVGRNASRANMVYLKAKREREMFRIEFAQEMRELKRRAIARVQNWMNESGNKKQITVDMVVEEIVSFEEDRKEYEALIAKQEDLREIRGNLEKLAELWSDRKQTLMSQVRLATLELNVHLGDRRE